MGLSFGTVAVATGLSVAKTVAMSLLLYSGGAQFLVLAAAAGGAGPVAMIVGGLVLNARHLPYGLVLADVLSGSKWRRLLGAHLMTDEATAFTRAQPDRAHARLAFAVAGVLLFLAWNLGTVIGALGGNLLGDPDALGVDAAFPAALLALVAPALRDRLDRRVAVAGATVALVLTPLLPAGVGVLAGLCGVVLAWRELRG